MTDQQAIDILKQYTAWVQLARGNGKSVTAFRYTWAITCAILALESRIPHRVTIKGKIFQRRYCPTCHEHVKKGQLFCHSCGQAIHDRCGIPLSTRVPPPPPPRDNGYKAETIVFDEFH